MTYFIIGFVFVMLIGNFMGAKPKDSQLLLDLLRMKAKQLGFLLSPLNNPDWLEADVGSHTMRLYLIVDDDWQLALMNYVVQDNHLLIVESTNNPQNHQSKIAMNIPSQIMPFIRGVSMKSNAIGAVFDEVAFALYLAKTKHPHPELWIDEQLSTLKTALIAWAKSSSV